MKQMIDTMMNRQSVKIQKQKNKTIILKKQLLKKWTGQADKEQIHMVMKVCGKIERKKWHHEREVMLAKIESQKNALEAKSMQIQELSLRQFKKDGSMTEEEILMKQVQTMYKTEPSHVCQSIVQKWKELGPIDAQAVLDKEGQLIDAGYEFQRLITTRIVCDGQLDKRERPSGFFRCQTKHQVLTEAFYIGYCGYQRQIYRDGSYYQGQIKNCLKHGEGKFVDNNGNTQEGDWQEDKFVGKK